MNNVTLIGRLGADPELHYTQSGLAVTTVSIAVNGRGDDEVDWFRIQVWEKLAESIAEHKLKGDQIAVTGRLKNNEWTTRDGNKMRDNVIVAHRIDYLANNNNRNPADQPDTEPAHEPAVDTESVSDNEPAADASPADDADDGWEVAEPGNEPDDDDGEEDGVPSWMVD